MQRMRSFAIVLFSGLLFFAFALLSSAAVHGDLDANDTVTAADARLALRGAVELEELTDEQTAAADLDHNGAVTAADARLILRLAVELESPDAFHTPSAADPAICAVCGEKIPEKPVGDPVPQIGAPDPYAAAGLKPFAAATPTAAAIGTDAAYEDADGNVIYLVKDSAGKLLLCYVIGPKFTVEGVSSGDVITDPTKFRRTLPDGTFLRYFTDPYNKNRVYAALLCYREELPIIKTSATHDDGMEKIMFAFVNAFRKINGMKPYVWEDRLRDFAREHSDDMGKNRYFAHTSPAGVTLGDRVNRAGFDYMLYGENIANGLLAMPYEPFDLWVHSQSHRANMLGSCKLSGVGLYIAPGVSFPYYWTQFFLTEF